MKKLQEIIEYRPKSQREDFLEYLLERGLDETERDVIVSIILSYFPKHNNWTLTMLIDLTNDELIIDYNLLNVYLSDFLSSKNYLIKLSVLDYISATKNLYKEALIPIDYSFIEHLANNKKDKFVVRNQALLILITAFPNKKEEYISQLKSNLKKTTDYRTHLRLYSNLPTKNISKNHIIDFIKISEAEDLGYAVELRIEEIKKELDL